MVSNLRISVSQRGKLAQKIEDWLISQGIPIVSGLGIDSIQLIGNNLYLVYFSYEDNKDQLRRGREEISVHFFDSGAVEDVKINGELI